MAATTAWSQHHTVVGQVPSYFLVTHILKGMPALGSERLRAPMRSWVVRLPLKNISLQLLLCWDCY